MQESLGLVPFHPVISMRLHHIKSYFSECALHVGDERQPEPARHAGVDQRIPAADADQDRAAVLRCCLLPVHGHALPRFGSSQESEVSSKIGTRVHTELQGSTSRFQTNGR